MTKLLQEAIEQVKRLPEDRQNELAEMLITAADGDLRPYKLTANERAAIEEAQTQVARGEFASDKKIAALWKKFGL